MIKKVKMSVGEAVVRFLDSQYVKFDGEETKFVEYFYSIFGHGCVLGIGEALAMTNHGLKVMQGKNEQGMAHAATSYAKQNNRRKIIPCVSSIGPGSANMITAAATATVNNVPLLLFLGDTFATRRPDPVLQQIEQFNDLTVTTNDAYKAVTRYFDRVSRPEMLESALNNAMRTLTNPATAGAVAIAMPQDVQGEVYNFPAYMFEKRVHTIRRPTPTADELVAAVAAIKKAKRPLIIVGGGVRYSEAGEVVKALSEQCNIPIAETQAGKSAIPGSYYLNFGGLGVTGNGGANKLAQKADLIIGLGTRFTDFTTASKTLFTSKKVLTVNVSDFHAEKLNAIPVIADVKATVSALLPKLKNYKAKYGEYIDEVKKYWADEMARLTSIKYSKDLVPEIGARTKTVLDDFHKASGSELCQTTAVGIVRKLIPADAIAVAAAGSLPGCMQRMWTTDAPYSYNMEYGYSCMGYEIAGAFGSKLAAPDKEVYAFCGDGSYLMLHSEMVTAIQEGKKINVLLFDNGGFGCINNLQMGKGIASLATEYRYNAEASTPFVPIDYAMSAKAYGYATYTAHNEKELETAIKASLKETKPTLIDIKVLPKTMTDGYDGGWWQVGATRNPHNEAENAALQDQLEHIKNN